MHCTTAATFGSSAHSAVLFFTTSESQGTFSRNGLSIETLIPPQQKDKLRNYTFHWFIAGAHGTGTFTTTWGCRTICETISPPCNAAITRRQYGRHQRIMGIIIRAPRNTPKPISRSIRTFSKLTEGPKHANPFCCSLKQNKKVDRTKV